MHGPSYMANALACAAANASLDLFEREPRLQQVADISAALRHVANLHKMRLAADAGDSVDFAMKRSGIHFSRERIVGDGLRLWSAPRLAKAMQQLADTALEARRNAALADAIAERALLSLAMAARRREN